MSSTYQGQYDEPRFNRVHRDRSMYPAVQSQMLFRIYDDNPPNLVVRFIWMRAWPESVTLFNVDNEAYFGPYNLRDDGSIFVSDDYLPNGDYVATSLAQNNNKQLDEITGYITVKIPIDPVILSAFTEGFSLGFQA